MKNIVISYNDWKVSCSEITDFDEIQEVVEKLNFKGYVSSVVGADPDGNPIEVKTRAVNRLSEMYDYDFSDCYLYKIERRDYVHYFVPEGKDVWEYDFVELERFDKESRYGYKIRYAGPEKKKVTQ
jgi:hypothetical protein